MLIACRVHSGIVAALSARVLAAVVVRSPCLSIMSDVCVTLSLDVCVCDVDEQQIGRTDASALTGQSAASQCVD